MRGARQDEKVIRTIPTPAHILKGADINLSLLDQAPQIFKEQHLGLYQFYDAILDGKPVPMDFREGMKVQEVVDAAIESDKKGCWIALPRCIAETSHPPEGLDQHYSSIERKEDCHVENRNQ